MEDKKKGRDCVKISYIFLLQEGKFDELQLCLNKKCENWMDISMMKSDKEKYYQAPFAKNNKDGIVYYNFFYILNLGWKCSSIFYFPYFLYFVFHKFPYFQNLHTVIVRDHRAGYTEYDRV